ENEVNFYYIDNNHVQIALNETTNIDDINQIIAIFAKALDKEALKVTELSKTSAIENSLLRTSTFLQHEVFNSYHSETALMRYIKKLERKDLSLNHSMISLGSCTMKLNAATEMLPLSLPNWSSIHPFVPDRKSVV